MKQTCTWRPEGKKPHKEHDGFLWTQRDLSKQEAQSPSRSPGYDTPLLRMHRIANKQLNKGLVQHNLIEELKVI